MSWPEVVVLVLVAAFAALTVYLIVKKGEIPWEKIRASEDTRKAEEAAAESEKDAKIRAILKEKERRLRDIETVLENATDEEKEQFDEAVRELASDIDALRGTVLAELERGTGGIKSPEDERGGRFSGGGGPVGGTRTED